MRFSTFLQHDKNLYVCVQDMELINILYLQDIDLGIGREAFDDLYADAAVTAVKGNECAQLKQV